MSIFQLLAFVWAAVAMSTPPPVHPAETENAEVAQCLHTTTREARPNSLKFKWVMAETHRQWREAVRLGSQSASDALACARLARTLTTRRYVVAFALGQVVETGLDAFQYRDIATLKRLAARYIPIAEQYKKTSEHGSSEEISMLIVILKQFAHGQCLIPECSGADYSPGPYGAIHAF